MVAAAAIGGAVIGAGATIYSGNKAADASAKGSKEAAAIQRYMYDTSREDYKPYLDTGISALGKLSSLYGIENPAANDPMRGAMTLDEFGNTIDPARLPSKYDIRSINDASTYDSRFKTAKNDLYNEYLANYSASQPPTPAQSTGPDYSGFYDSPDYKFAMDQGLTSVNQSMAKRGLSGSGAEMKALTRFGQGLASQQLGNYKNSLAALAGIGQASTGQISNLGANAASNMGNAAQNAADSRASSYLNQGAALSGLANRSADAYALYNKP